MPQEQAGYEYFCTLAFRSWTDRVPEESVELETFGHEYSFSSFLEHIFKVSLVCVCGQVMNRTVRCWVKQSWINLVTRWQWCLSVTDKILKSSFCEALLLVMSTYVKFKIL